MIKKLLPFVMMLSAILTCTSCLNSDDEDVTYYDDTAITAFSLGTLKRYMTTTASDGSDSTYTASLTGSSYAFYIDQINHRIYNPDSLPVGTDVKHILCTISTKNGGTPVIVLRNQIGADSLAYYTTTDSIDFSQPVRIRVYSNSGVAVREYTVAVNVHQQTGDEFAWTSDSVTALAAMAGRKLVENQGTLYLFGTVAGQTVAYRHSGTTWTAVEGVAASASAYKNIAAMGGYLYMLDGTTLRRSADGTAWTDVATPAITSLIGASPKKLYALTDKGLASSADGISWTEETLDSDAGLLPTSSTNFICRASRTNADTYQLIIIGTRDSKPMVWSKIEEDDANAQSQPWFFYSADEYNQKTLPVTSRVVATRYNDGVLALEGTGATFYFSPDNALTWDATSIYALAQLPSLVNGAPQEPVAMASDSQNVLYLSAPGSPLVFHGRLARLAWTTNQTAFTE